MDNNNDDTLKPKELAQLLDVSPSWLKHNRRSNNPLPSRKWGYRTYFYVVQDILHWFGLKGKNIILKFYSTKSMAKRIGMSVRWLKANRAGDDPIPVHYMGKLARYNETEYQEWLKRQSKAPHE